MKKLFTTSGIKRSLTVCALAIFAQVSVQAAEPTALTTAIKAITGLQTAWNEASKTVTVTGTATTTSTLTLNYTVKDIIVDWQATLSSSAATVVKIASTSNATNTKFNMTAGAITSTSTTMPCYVLYVNERYTAVNISGGTIISAESGTTDWSYGIYNASTGTVTISDNALLLVGNNGTGNNSYPSIGIHNTSGTINMLGGTIQANSSVYFMGILLNGAGSINISGGSIIGSTSASYGIFNNTYSVGNGATGPINMSGGSITDCSYGISNGYRSTITISGGSINAKAAGIVNPYFGSTGYKNKIKVEGGTIFGTKYGIHDGDKGNGDIEVTGGTISSATVGTYYAAISCINECNIKITGGKVFNTKGWGIRVTNDAATLEISGDAVVFGKDATSAIKRTIQPTPTDNAAIITWTGSETEYTKNSNTDLSVVSGTGTATAVWDLSEGLSGVSSGSSFIPVSSVTVSGGTGINDANADNPIIRTEYYDVNGKKLSSKPAKGFYIENNFHENGTRSARTMGAF
jgi:hypothetical protein